MKSLDRFSEAHAIVCLIFKKKTNSHDFVHCEMSLPYPTTSHRTRKTLHQIFPTLTSHPPLTVSNLILPPLPFLASTRFFPGSPSSLTSSNSLPCKCNPPLNDVPSTSPIHSSGYVMSNPPDVLLCVLTSPVMRTPFALYGERSVSVVWPECVCVYISD